MTDPTEPARTPLDDALAAFSAACNDLSTALAEVLAPAFRNMRDVFAAAIDILGAAGWITDYPTDHDLRRHAIEHLDIPESDIKRIDHTHTGPVVILKNWRRIPIDIPPRNRPHTPKE